MRNPISPLLAAATLAALSSPAAYADTVPAAIQARYDTLIAAMEKIDLKAYDAYYPAEYVSVDPSGKSVSRAEYLAGVHDLLKGARKVAVKVVYTGVKAHGGLVDVSFDAMVKISNAQGTSMVHEVGTDTWKKVGKVWWEVKTVDKSVDLIAPKTKARK